MYLQDLIFCDSQMMSQHTSNDTQVVHLRGSASRSPSTAHQRLTNGGKSCRSVRGLDSLKLLGGGDIARRTHCLRMWDPTISNREESS